MKGPLGYGRYNSDPNWIGCPRAKTSETPCAARDGTLATDSRYDGAVGGERPFCVGCGEDAADLLKALVRHVTEPS